MQPLGSTGLLEDYLEGKWAELSCANPKWLWVLGMNPVGAPNLLQHNYLLHSQLQKPLAKPHGWDRINFLGWSSFFKPQDLITEELLMCAFISLSAAVLTAVPLGSFLDPKNLPNGVAPWPRHFQGPGPPSQTLSQLGTSLSSNCKGWGGGEYLKFWLGLSPLLHPQHFTWAFTMCCRTLIMLSTAWWDYG